MIDLKPLLIHYIGASSNSLQQSPVANSTTLQDCDAHKRLSLGFILIRLDITKISFACGVADAKGAK